MSHFGKWRRTQDYCKSQDKRCECVQQVVETTWQVQGIRCVIVESLTQCIQNHFVTWIQWQLQKQVWSIPSSQVYKPKVNGAALSLCIVNDIRAEGKKFPSTFCTSRIWAISNIASFVRAIQSLIISQETWSAGFVTSLDHKELSKTKKYKHIANRWMLVINTSCRVK